MQEVTILLDKVFLVHRRTPEVEVYDTGTLALQNRFPVIGLVVPSDITSSFKYGCLYISNRGYTNITNSLVQRVEVNNTTTKWPFDDAPCGMSVPSDGSNVIVTCDEARKLKEYTTNGRLEREIILEEDLIHSWLAIQLSNGQFLVSQGYGRDLLHRVCLVGADGRFTKCYGGSRGCSAGQLNGPLHLSVDQHGSVIVLDSDNKRVLLLNASLAAARELIFL